MLYLLFNSQHGGLIFMHCTDAKETYVIVKEIAYVRDRGERGPEHIFYERHALCRRYACSLRDSARSHSLHIRKQSHGLKSENS
jgi:hypothetical protein